MKNFIAHFIALFIPVRKVRRRVREKLKLYGVFGVFCKNACIFPYTKVVWGKKRYNISGNNNKVIIMLDDKEYVLPRRRVIRGLDLSMAGNNNVVKIGFPQEHFHDANFRISGENTVIQINKSCYEINKLRIMALHGHNKQIVIGENLYVGSLFLHIEEHNSSIVIGKDCMFSSDLFFRHGDGHSLIDKKGNLLNQATQMVIGDHVWVGGWCRLLKNVRIANGCVVGMGSIVTKQFTEENCAIAGNPAKVIKRDIHWVREPINVYNENKAKQKIGKRKYK